jgi:NAD(P)-dependent dehydrogenase (short-subunit alcohol dehydrogenase family)
MGEFEGRVALVTGGALGIGEGIARAFAREGAGVAIADVKRAEAEALTEEIRDAGGRAVATIGDVSNAADAERMVAETVEALGRLDVLVNNAGILPPDWYLPVDQMPEDVWDRTIDVNLKGVYLMSRFSIPRIREGAWPGAIVNISSVQGLQSMPRVPAYSASKGGVLSLTRAMALDYAPEGIRVNAICPGTIDTEMVRAVARTEGGDLQDKLRDYGTFHPLGRIGRASDIGEAVLFLASPRASFITGEHLCVDGGFMALGAWAGSAGAGRAE